MPGRPGDAGEEVERRGAADGQDSASPGAGLKAKAAQMRNYNTTTALYYIIVTIRNVVDLNTRPLRSARNLDSPH